MVAIQYPPSHTVCLHWSSIIVTLPKAALVRHEYCTSHYTAQSATKVTPHCTTLKPRETVRAYTHCDDAFHTIFKIRVFCESKWTAEILSPQVPEQ
ncbi:hypothetical protein PoB_004328700 [Plakobranchus ocellatus]|uniref:Uncharacterized protein n=1 Tax=Plakobranchus ocellatus TaxID=259542 RepID=A0AAV4BC56_9GAST|nr:hypothetical protein PoB_004328700 [Plakobranchus ocellatus]